eukprot:TRINITY_DN66046_c2_g7_i1.p2 TRINITY_DN66046_c2_g7~~TRINITY_DN66046_c2_g7_i1.p2  ORF type:complete len:304 (+),score=23.79 TRINITY_DN66046_c2_g7_i1:38-949(+)
MVERLSSRVIRIMGHNPGPFTLTGSCTYLVGTGNRRILVDTGEGKKEYVQSLQEALSENNCKISHVVLTHRHRDHTGGLPDVLSMADGLEVVKLRSPYDKDSLGVTQWINDNATIQAEGATLRALHTPGHIEDHICLWLEEEKAVFSGDNILGTGTTVFKNLKQYLGSLRRILDTKPEIIYPGHGPVITDGVGKVSQYIQHRAQREQQILETLKAAGKSLTPLGLVEKIYTETPKHLFPAAAVNVVQHLQKLEEDGVVSVDRSNAAQPEGETAGQDDMESADVPFGIKRDLPLDWTYLNSASL